MASCAAHSTDRSADRRRARAPEDSHGRHGAVTARPAGAGWRGQRPRKWLAVVRGRYRTCRGAQRGVKSTPSATMSQPGGANPSKDWPSEVRRVFMCNVKKTGVCNRRNVPASMSSSRRPSVLTHTPRGHEMSTQPTAVDAHAHGSNHRSPQTALKWSRTTRVQVTLHGCNKRPSTTYRRSPASCPGGPSPTAGPERRMQRARRTGRRHERQSAAVREALGLLP